MYDLKLYVKDDKNLKRLLVTTTNFCDHINMESAFDVCAKASLKGGKLISNATTQLEHGTFYQGLEPRKLL